MNWESMNLSTAKDMMSTFYSNVSICDCFHDSNHCLKDKKMIFVLTRISWGRASRGDFTQVENELFLHIFFVGVVEMKSRSLILGKQTLFLPNEVLLTSPNPTFSHIFFPIAISLQLFHRKHNCKDLIFTPKTENKTNQYHPKSNPRKTNLN